MYKQPDKQPEKKGGGAFGKFRKLRATRAERTEPSKLKSLWLSSLLPVGKHDSMIRLISSTGARADSGAPGPHLFGRFARKNSGKSSAEIRPPRSYLADGNLRVEKQGNRNGGNIGSVLGIRRGGGLGLDEEKRASESFIGCDREGAKRGTRYLIHARVTEIFE